MFLLIILDVIVSILDIAFLVLLLFLIDSYERVKPAYVDSLFIKLLGKQPIFLIGLFFLLFALKNWFAFLVIKKQYYFVYEVSSRLSEQKLLTYANGSYSDYNTIDSSIHSRTINHDTVEFAHYVLRGFQQVISQTVLIIITFIPIIIFRPVLFSLLLLVLLPPVILLAFMMKRRSHFIRASMKATHEKVMQHLTEAIAGFVESNIYQKKNFFINRFVNFRKQQGINLAEQQIMQSLPPRLIEVFAIGGLFLLIVINSLTTGSSIGILTIGAFMAAAYKIIPGIVKILNSMGQIKAYSYTMNNLVLTGYLKEADFEERAVDCIEFKNVCFEFENEKLLTDLSFKIAKGDLVGIVGGSGKGKTTLLNLLLGFLKPGSGTVLVNGATGNTNGLQRHWNQISYIKQQPFFIHDSIEKNITLDERIDHQKLDALISITGIDNILNKYAEGINATIAENGKNLSGGQRQRIAFARALYKNADIILLDEPFSELDNESERCLLQHLEELSKKGKMIILITHNKESLSFCTKIIDLDKG